MSGFANYDELLKLFLSKDDLRPALCQANTVGSKTYSTNAHSLIIIPNELLTGKYPAHENTPNYQHVINFCKSCDPITFTDTSLFKALASFPKEFDKVSCEKCEGEGSCEHCGQECGDCDGEGVVADESLDKVYTTDRAGIKIGDLIFGPFELGKLEKVLLETMSDTFEVIAFGNTSIVIRISNIEILIARLGDNFDKDKSQVYELKPEKIK